RRATWLELFYDLVFVVVIFQLAHKLEEDISLNGFLGFLALFVPVWWSWIGAAFYATRFDTDDLGHRILVLLQMVGAAFLAVYVSDAFGEGSVGFALSYAAIRIILVLEYVRTGTSKSFSSATSLIRQNSIGYLIAAIMWIISAFVPPPFRFVLWGIGLVIDFATPIVVGKLHSQFAPHKSHLPERMGLFTILVLGESILEVVLGISNTDFDIYSMLVLGLSLGISFSLWWLYFDGVDGAPISVLREKGKIGVYSLWLFGHFPLVVAITSVGVGLGYIMSKVHVLVLSYIEQWLVCGSVALALGAQGVLHLSSAYSYLYNGSVQDFRVSIRWATYRIISVAMILLIPVLRIPLPPLSLVCILTAICAAQIVIDLKQHPYQRRSQALK
ncbi:MAG TPA: low temperature requirement protein A, partial [Nitrososphaeraceae archaeon]